LHTVSLIQNTQEHAICATLLSVRTDVTAVKKVCRYSARYKYTMMCQSNTSLYIYIYIYIYIVCPTRYRTRNFFNNSNIDEDIAKKFEHEYVRCVRNEEECVCRSLQISLQYPH